MGVDGEAGGDLVAPVTASKYADLPHKGWVTLEREEEARRILSEHVATGEAFMEAVFEMADIDLIGLRKVAFRLWAEGWCRQPLRLSCVFSKL
jgi:hypothetical protein